MRVPAGAVIVEPWTNTKKCIECIIEKGVAFLVIEEPILALATVVREGVALLKNVLIVVGPGSLALRKVADALECACDYLIVVEKDTWGKAREPSPSTGVIP